MPRGSHGLDHISKKFAEVYKPNRDIAVDEAMIKFQGRSCLKQYMPIKSIKYGIEVCVAADSANGYISRFKSTVERHRRV